MRCVNDAGERSRREQVTTRTRFQLYAQRIKSGGWCRNPTCARQKRDLRVRAGYFSAQSTSQSYRDFHAYVVAVTQSLLAVQLSFPEGTFGTR